jgi:dephospho-CoA kinase
MLKIGLTGSIASGKSTIARMFSALGVHVIDTDVIARQVVAPGSPGLAKLTAEFGQHLLNDDGSLNRQLLGELIFADQGKRQRLNEFFRPLIMSIVGEEMRKYGRQYPDGMVMVDVPLLIEENLSSWFDQIILVYVPVAVQLERLKARDGIDAETARLKMSSQVSPEEKRKYADFVIDNSSSLALSRAQVENIFLCLQTV